MARVVIGVDIGGTKTAVLAVRLPGAQVLHKVVMPTRAARGEAQLRAALGDLLCRMRSRLGLPSGTAIGVSVPELVDTGGTVTTEVVVPGLAGNLRRRWAELGVVGVEADVRAAAIAEARFGAGRDLDSLAYVSIGTGISSTLVLNGTAWPGANGAAILLGTGSLGPMRATQDTCSQSPPFILEQIASGAAIASAYRRLSGRAASAQEVLRKYARDTLAAQVVDEAGDAAGQAVAVLVNLLDPEAVIVGGGLGTAGGPYWHRLEASARTHIWAEAARHVRLLRAGLGSDSAAIGASMLADSQPRHEPAGSGADRFSACPECGPT